MNDAPVLGVTPVAELNAANALPQGLTHVVMFRLRERDEETLGAIQERIRGLMGKVPSLLALEVGVDVLCSERSFDVVLIARFASLDGLAAYQTHPAHQQVLAFLAQHVAASVAVDYLG